MKVADYSKFLVAFGVTLLTIISAYLGDHDYKIAITAAIAAVGVLIVPNVPQFPWVKGLVEFVAAGVAFYFASDTPNAQTIIMAVVMGFGAIGVYGVTNDDTDARGIRPQHLGGP